MTSFLIFTVLLSFAATVVNGQQGEKGNSIIPFPRVGRSGGNNLIPFPRIGKRQLIPFPRVGKRAFWRLPVEAAFYTEYEDFNTMDNPSAGGVMESPSEEGDVDKRGGTPNSSGMWFGPRLGRKKRSVQESSHPAVEEDTKESATTSIDMKPVLKMLHNSDWAVIVPVRERRNFTPRLGKRSDKSDDDNTPTVYQPFSPRLGRSGEVATAVIFDDEDDYFKSLQTRSTGSQELPPPSEDPTFDRTNGPPFNPRLGRAEPFSPRLGRAAYNFSPRLGRSSYDPFSPRLGRGGDPFSPRLGRGDPFSPRLGRGDPFSPRLGRGDPFSPRLGRGDPFSPRLG